MSVGAVHVPVARLTGFRADEALRLAGGHLLAFPAPEALEIALVSLQGGALFDHPAEIVRDGPGGVLRASGSFRAFGWGKLPPVIHVAPFSLSVLPPA